MKKHRNDVCRLAMLLAGVDGTAHEQGKAHGNDRRRAARRAQHPHAGEVLPANGAHPAERLERVAGRTVGAFFARAVVPTHFLSLIDPHP